MLAWLICDVQDNRKEDMTVLKQHRKADLRLEGRKLSGEFEVSLTNEGDRTVLKEFLTEVRKQMREFDPSKKKGPKKRR